MPRRALVTGAAGFIGSHLVDRLLAEGGWQVVGVDNFDPFYDASEKEANIAAHLENPNYRLLRFDLRDPGAVAALPKDVDVIVHLAAKAGVAPSLRQPTEYYEANVRATQNLLEFARSAGIGQFVFASSSSVYGVNPDVPWREDSAVLKPISPYASTKVSGELLGHVYSHLYGIRFLALRFFTVYGPRQRPDLAIRSFATRLLAGQEITLFGDGTTRRDYTFVDDIIAGVRAAMDYDSSNYEVINLGNSHAVELRELVAALEAVLGVKARLRYAPERPGDVPQTWAEVSKASRLLGYRPTTPLHDGLRVFAEWIARRSGSTAVPSR